ncbi:hypothetical protein [Melittangium boletus]|uniref:hypothetical protein n=1 Tax=Melittangium boletus TaxID=83453 RepID=UPI003DA4B55C
MPSRPLSLLVGGLVLASPAFAQDEDTPYSYPDDEPSQSRRGRATSPDEDTPYAYPDDEEGQKERPSRRRAPERPERDMHEDFRRAAEGEDEEKDFQRMANLDDPNTGVAFEVIGGVMFLSSARGQTLGDAQPAFGGRFTWEYGRLLNSEPLREALWFDVRYTYAGQREGTGLIVGDTRLHYATIAPAYEFTFGDSSDYGVFLQAGGGIAYQHTAIEAGGKVTVVDGVKSLIQYGVGLRGRTQLSAASNVRLAWRLEAQRYRRGYQDDTFFGASLGTAF